MVRMELEMAAPDGRCPATLHLPEGGGPWPGVVVFPDAGGVRETFRLMADRLAAGGYGALLPDVYYRSGEWAPFDMATVFGDAAERARLCGMLAGLTRPRISADTGAYLACLLARPEVAGAAAGTTGYCLGGRMSLLAAGEHPDMVAAAAAFHPGRIAVANDPDSPHQAAPRITGRVYVAGAEQDASFTLVQAQLLESALTAAGVRHTVEFSPARHGFAVPDNPTHDPDAEARHWAALDDLYAAELGR